MIGRAALLLALAAAPSVARADADEASVHVHATGGVAQLADDASEDAATAPTGGVAVRASLARSDWYQYDAALGFAATGAARFERGDFQPAGRPPVSGPFALDAQLVRVDAGVTVRLGVEWIPTIRVFVGAQGRRRGPTDVDLMGAMTRVRAAELGGDLIAGVGLGLDHRLDRRLVVGAAVGAAYAVPLAGEPVHTLDATVHAAYYWYPRW